MKNPRQEFANRREKYLSYKEAPKGDDLRATCHPDRKHYAKGMCVTCYDASGHQKRYPKHKESIRKRSHAYYHSHKEEIHLKEIARKFGLPAEEYKAMLERQKGLCALCGKPPRFRGYLCVDHCHDRQKYRELLCITCNSGLGQFYDDPELLDKAAAYLRRHDDKNSYRNVAIP